MYSRRFRTPLLLLLLVASAQSQPYVGWPWSIDAWIAAGMRGWSPASMRLTLLAMAIAIVLADRWFSGAPGRVHAPWHISPSWVAPIVFGVAVALLWTLRVEHWEGDFVGLKVFNEPSYFTAVAETAE